MRYSIQRKSSAILCLGLAITSAVSSSISSAFSFRNFSFSDLTNTASNFTQRTRKFLSSSIEKMYNFLSSKPSKEETTSKIKERNETKEKNESVENTNGETKENIVDTLYNIVDKVGIFAFFVLAKVAAGAYNEAVDNIVTEFVEQNNNDTNKEKTKNIKEENTNSSKQNEGETKDKGAETRGNNIEVKESKDNLKNEETSSVVKNVSNLKDSEINKENSKNTELAIAKNAGSLEKLGTKKDDSNSKEIAAVENSQQVNSWAYDALFIFDKLNMLDLKEKDFEDLEKVFDIFLFDGGQNFEPIDFKKLYIEEGFNKGSNVEELKDKLKGKKIVFSEKTDVKNNLGEGQAANIIENMLTDGNNSTELVTKSNANNFKNLGTNSENSNSTEITLNKTPELKNVYGYDALSFFNRLKTEGLGKTNLNNFDFSLHEYSSQILTPINLNDLFFKYKNEDEEAFKDYLKGKEVVISEKTDNKNKLVDGQTINNKNMLTDGNVANEAENVSNKKDMGSITRNTNTNKEKEKEEKITENKVENLGENNSKDEKGNNTNINKNVNSEDDIDADNNIINENTVVNQKTDVEKEGKNEERNNIDQNSNEQIDINNDLNKKEETNNENIVKNNSVNEKDKKIESTSNVVEKTNESNKNYDSKTNEEKSTKLNENINDDINVVNKEVSQTVDENENKIKKGTNNLSSDNNGNETEEIKREESQEDENVKKKGKINKKRKSLIEYILDKFDENKDLKKQLVDRATDLICERSDVGENTKDLIKKVKEDFDALRDARNKGKKGNSAKAEKDNLKESIGSFLSPNKGEKFKNKDLHNAVNEFYKTLLGYISSDEIKNKAPNKAYIKFYVNVRNALIENEPALDEGKFTEMIKEKFSKDVLEVSGNQT